MCCCRPGPLGSGVRGEPGSTQRDGGVVRARGDQGQGGGAGPHPAAEPRAGAPPAASRRAPAAAGLAPRPAAPAASAAAHAQPALQGKTVIT